MRFKRLLSPPRSSWWFAAAPVGLLLPIALKALIYLGGYFPPGGLLPGSSWWSELAYLVLLYLVMLVLLVITSLWSLLSWNWRPLAIAFLFGACALVGLWPAEAAGRAMRATAFELFTHRSDTLIRAIDAFVHDKGMPPRTLEALVPDYMAAIPTTGMATGPEYYFAPERGPCSVNNTWHIWVSPHYPPLESLLYCPKRDYEKSAWGSMGKAVRDWFLVRY